MSRTILKLESLGGRTMPSAVLPAAQLNTAIVQHHDALTGHGQGCFATTVAWGDAGTQYHLAGSAQVAGMGGVIIDGCIGGVGFIQRGYAHGTLTFTNTQGSVTVELTSVTEQNGFSPPPHYFRYRITGGTGAYQHLQEIGTLRIDLLPPPATVAHDAHGSFRLAI